jgi:hypothetical protein
MAPIPSVVEVASILLFIGDGVFGGFVNGVAGARTFPISQLSSTSSLAMTIPPRGEKIFLILTVHPPSCASDVEGLVLVLSISVVVLLHREIVVMLLTCYLKKKIASTSGNIKETKRKQRNGKGQKKNHQNPS